MSTLKLPEGYKSELDLYDTQIAGICKQYFILHKQFFAFAIKN